MNESRGIQEKILNELKKVTGVIALHLQHKIHPNVTCNQCGCDNIKGIRYKCLFCKDYDLCDVCESTNVVNVFHDPTHSFIKITDTSIFNHQMHSVSSRLFKDH